MSEGRSDYQKGAEFPLISIVLTSFNTAELVESAILSALSQDWPNIELIVVDDASNDRSVEIIRRCISGHPHARLFVNPENRGAAAARNAAIKVAHGEFVAFFDGDDVSYPQRLQCQYERLISYEREAQAEIVLCYASGERRYPNGYRKDLMAIGSVPQVPKGELVAEYLLYFRRAPGVCYGSGTPTCSLFVRREVLIRCGGFDEQLRRVEDVDLAIRLAIMGAHFIGCKERLFLQCATIGTHKSAASNVRAEVDLAHKHRDFLYSRRRYAYAACWPRLRYYHFTQQHGRLIWSLLGLFARYPTATLRHLLSTGPKRLQHEWMMRRRMQ